MKLYITLFTILMMVIPGAMAAKRDKANEKITAKVWFKDGHTYEGELVKHWLTRRQTYPASGHNFHIKADSGDKSIKCEVSDTDSILITSSTHPDFQAGDFYVALNTNKKDNPIGGGRAAHKMLKREYAGRNVEFCKLTYIGNCMIGNNNMDQWMEWWMLRFRESGQVVIFFSNPLEKGCNKPRFTGGMSEIAKFNPALADALVERFSSKDKKERNEIAGTIQENPLLYVDFIDNYLTDK